MDQILIAYNIDFNEEKNVYGILLIDVIKQVLKETIPKTKIMEIIKLDKFDDDTYIAEDTFIELLLESDNDISNDILNKYIVLVIDDLEEYFMPMYGYEKYYKLSNKGDVISLRSGNKLKPTLAPSGYLFVNICIDKNHIKRITIQLHPIMAKSFYGIPDKNKKLIVDHIDGHKDNNHINNLRFLAKSGNSLNAYATGNHKGNGKAVYKLNNEGNILDTYTSISEAARKNNLKSAEGIRQCCIGQQLTAGGFKWKYVEEKKEIILEKDEKFVTIPKIKGYTYSKYTVSNYGKIYNSHREEYLEPTFHEGYYKIALVSDSGKRFNHRINRLVGFGFIPLPKNYNPKFIVHHIDENKQNNYYKNLKWATQKRNVEYSCGKKVIKMFPNGKIIKKYNSINDAARSVADDNESIISIRTGIVKCCNGKQQTAHSYKWKFVK